MLSSCRDIFGIIIQSVDQETVTRPQRCRATAVVAAQVHDDSTRDAGFGQELPDRSGVLNGVRGKAWQADQAEDE